MTRFKQITNIAELFDQGDNRKRMVYQLSNSDTSSPQRRFYAAKIEQVWALWNLELEATIHIEYSNVGKGKAFGSHSIALAPGVHQLNLLSVMPFDRFSSGLKFGRDLRMFVEVNRPLVEDEWISFFGWAEEEGLELGSEEAD